jgi:hypothetical protein
MIVKNEVKTINKTLASMRDDLDYWTIVDTGSSDGTQVSTHMAIMARIFVMMHTALPAWHA